MALIFGDVDGQSSLVQRVWTATCDAPTEFTSVVKGASMLCFARIGGDRTVNVKGPETSASQMSCPADSEFFGVELQIGVYLPMFPPAGLTDFNNALLPTTPAGRLVLDNRDWEVPTEQNVDVFVERLARADLLITDPLVDKLRHDDPPPGMSERTAQLRFRQAVGMSRRKLLSVDRARAAARLLAAGGSIADAIVTGGYYDHPHLSRAMRWATGHSPSELRAGTRRLAF